MTLNQLGVVKRNIVRADKAAVEKLSKFGVATIHEAMGRVGLMKPYMRPIYAGAQIAGSAVTVLAQPGDNWMIHVAIEQVRPGDLLVVACTTDNTDGMFGDLLATSLMARGGVGLIIECLTDNRNRAAAEVRSTLTKGNGSLATTGSVSFNFERKGQIVVPAEGVDFDNLFEKAAEAGAEDVTDDGEVFTVITDPSDMIDVRKALQDAGFDYDSADLVMMPKNEVELSLEDAQKVSKLIDNLDDLDDVQNIYSNWTASDEVMAQLDEE